MREIVWGLPSDTFLDSSYWPNTIKHQTYKSGGIAGGVDRMGKKRFWENYQSRCIIWHQLVSQWAIVFGLAAFVVYLDVVLWTTGAQGYAWRCWLGGYCKSRLRFDYVTSLCNCYFTQRLLLCLPVILLHSPERTFWPLVLHQTHRLNALTLIPTTPIQGRLPCRGQGCCS